MTPLLAGFGIAAAVVALLVALAMWHRRGEHTGGRDWASRADDATSLDDVAAWFHHRRACAEAHGDQAHAWVGDATWRDLEGDALFRAVDHTDSPLGRQALYAALRSPDAPRCRAAIDAVARACVAHPAVRDDIRRALRPHRGSGGYRMHVLVQDRDLAPRWASAAPVLAVALAGLLLGAPWRPHLLLVAVPLALVGITVSQVGLRDLGRYLGPMRELAPVLAAARRLAAVVEHLDLPRAERDALRAALQPEGVPLVPLARITRMVRPDFGAAEELLGSLYGYVNLVLLLDVNALWLTGRTLRRHRTALERLFATVGLVDVGCAVGALRTTRAWCAPEFAPQQRTLRFDALRHPTLPQGVANDVRLALGRGLLLTGANMSGKSTLLRAIGTNVLLARALATCTAQAAVLPCTDVCTSIGHADDLQRGVSYFYAEAQAVARLLRRADGAPALFLFDELFRGTNAAERIAAAEAVLRHITRGAGQRPAQWVALASHDLQLGDLLGDCFEVAHLAVATDGAALDFQFRLQPGPATTRTALALLAQCGVEAALLDSARQRAALLEGRAPS